MTVRVALQSAAHCTCMKAEQVPDGHGTTRGPLSAPYWQMLHLAASHELGAGGRGVTGGEGVVVVGGGVGGGVGGSGAVTTGGGGRGGAAGAGGALRAWARALLPSVVGPGNMHRFWAVLVGGGATTMGLFRLRGSALRARANSREQAWRWTAASEGPAAAAAARSAGPPSSGRVAGAATSAPASKDRTAALAAAAAAAGSGAAWVVEGAGGGVAGGVPR